MAEATDVSMRKKNRLQGCARLTQPAETIEPSIGPHASRLDPRPKGPKYLQVRTPRGLRERENERPGQPRLE